MGVFLLLRGRSPAVLPTGTAPYVIPGTFTVGGAAWAADTYNTAQGTVLQEGYTVAPAGCSWANTRYDRSLTTGEIYVGVVAAGTPDLTSYFAGDVFCNLKEVQIAIGGGAYVSVTAPSLHPVTGRLAYWARVRASDLPGGAVSGMYEVRARVIPKVGQPYLMQGADSQSYGVCYQDTTSSYVLLDKGDLPRLVLYKGADNDASAANDPANGGSNTGLTTGSPLYTWDSVSNAITSHPNYATGVTVTVYLLASQNHEWGRAGADASATIEAPHGWTTVTPAPGLTAADVKIDRDKGFRLFFRKLSLEAFTLGNVYIRNFRDAGDNYLALRQRGLVSGRPQTVDTNLHATVNFPVTTTSSSQDAFQGVLTWTSGTGEPAGSIPSDPSNALVSIFNAGSNPAYVKYTTNGSTATTSDTLIAAGATVSMTPNNTLNAISTGGSTTLQVTALNAFYGQPTPLKWAAGGTGVIEVLEQTISWSGDSGCWGATYIRDVVVDHVSNRYGDIADNAKYISGLRIKNTATIISYNHLDALQPIKSGLQSAQNNKWWEDVTVLESDGAYMQFILMDSSNYYMNSVFLRMKARATSWALTAAGAIHNIRFIDPDLSGGDNVTTLSYADSGNPLYNAPYSDVHFLFDSTGLGAGTGSAAGSYWEIMYRQGIRLWYPFLTQEPNPGNTVPTSGLVTALGSASIVDVFDPDVPEFIGRIHHDQSDPPVFLTGGATHVRFLADAHIPQLEGGSSNIASSNALLMQQATDSKRPVTVEGTHRSMTFDGVSQFLNGKIPPKDQTTNKSVSVLGVNDPATIVMALYVDPSDTSASTHFYWHCGRTDVTSTYIGHTYTGGKHQIIVGAGQTDGSADTWITLTSSENVSGGTNYSANPDASGNCVVVYELLSDRIRITYYNAATGSGGAAAEKLLSQNSATKLTLKHTITNGNNQALGCNSVPQAPYGKMRFYGQTKSALLDSATLAAVVAAMKARVGLS